MGLQCNMLSPHPNSRPGVLVDLISQSKKEDTLGVKGITLVGKLLQYH